MNSGESVLKSAPWDDPEKDLNTCEQEEAPSEDLALIARLPVGQKVIVKWAKKWYQGTVSERGPVRMFKVHYKRWSEKFDDYVRSSQLRTIDGECVATESELVVGWQGRTMWGKKSYNATVIGHTWGLVKVHCDGDKNEYDNFFPADCIQLVNNRQECVPLHEVDDTSDTDASNDTICNNGIEETRQTRETIDQTGSHPRMDQTLRHALTMPRTRSQSSSPRCQSAAKRHNRGSALVSSRLASGTSLILAHAAEGQAETALVALAQSLNGLVNSKLFSDVSFRCCDNVTVHAHRNILSVRSDYFKELFTTNPDQKAVIDVEVDSSVLKQTLFYVYTGTFNVTSANAFQLYQGADLWCLTELKDLCLSVITDYLDTENVLKSYTMSISQTGNSDAIKELCCQYMSQHYQEVTSRQEFASLEKSVMVHLIRDVSVYLKASS